MITLPQLFLDRMKERLGKDFPAFLRTYEQPVYRAVRVNTLKLSREEFCALVSFALEGNVEWDGNAYYTKEEKAGGYLAHFAGLYYCQEPSATCSAPLLNVQKGERVLDLCAAPGGKTGQLAQALQGEGLLVANEYVFDRARILAQNLERLGVKNAVITSGDSAVIAQKFPAFFDKVLVDAPCSGEGMFKKEPAALTEWSEDNVTRCALRQREILHNASLAVKGGGLLAYSTCTFAPQENEEQIAWFLEEHPNFILKETHALLPHEVKGEGHFAALLQRVDCEEGLIKYQTPTANKEAQKAFADFCKDFFTGKYEAVCTSPAGAPEQLFALPHPLPALNGLPCLRAGLFLGWYEKGVFKPSHALAMSVKREEVKRFISLTDAQAEKYLHGETVQTDCANGWCVVGWKDYPIGIGKVVNGVVKNHYPKGLRKVK